MRFDVAAFPPFAQPFSNFDVKPILLSTDSSIETELDNKIKVYKNSAAIDQMSELVTEYLSFSESQGFVQISHEHWIKNFLKPDWELRVLAIKLKFYLLGNKSQHLKDKMFDKMYSQGYLKFPT